MERTLSAENLTSLISRLNNERSIELLPVIVYMVLLGVLGIFGNILVIYVYGSRLPKITSSYFILCLGVFDLVTCTIGIPFDLVDLAHWYDFQNPVLCKCLRSVTYFTVSSSAMILVVVVFDRYYKICKPVKCFRVRTTKILIAVAISVGVVVSAPALWVFGDADMYIAEYNVTTVQCSVSTHFVGSLFPMIYYAVLVLIFIVCTTLLIVMYSVILSSLRKQNRKLSHLSNEPTRTDTQTNLLSVELTTDATNGNPAANVKTKNESIRLNNTEKITRKTVGGRKDINVERTTAIFFTISVIFALSYLPCLILVVLRAIKPEIEKFSNLFADVMYNLFMRSYFLNNTVNSFIYGFLNQRFRKETAQLLKRIFRPCSNLCALMPHKSHYNVNARGSSTVESAQLSTAVVSIA